MKKPRFFKNPKNAILFMGGIACFLLAGALAVPSLAWFIQVTDNADLTNTTGQIHSSYFKGDGTEDNPYVIEEALHVYYFNWLQDVGYFNQVKDGKVEKIHFIVGDAHIRDGSSVDAEHPLWDATPKTIDCSEYILPPAGTERYPFVGYFDGNGSVLANLNISNKWSELTDSIATDLANNAMGDGAVITGAGASGFFGLLGDPDGNNSVGALQGTTGEDGITTYSTTNASVDAYGSDEYAIQNIGFDNANVKTVSGGSIVGLVAGYVNAPMTGVAVKGGKIDSSASSVSAYSSNLSDFSLVGGCDPKYINESTDSSSIYDVPTISNPYDQQGGNEWGGSIDMKSMHARVNDIRINYAARRDEYAFKDVVTISPEGDETIESKTTTNNRRFYTSEYQKSGVTFNNKIGSFVFDPFDTDDASDLDSDNYLYLSGGHYSEKSYETYVDVSYSGFNISHGTHHLSANTSGIVDIDTSTSTATPVLWSGASNGGVLSANIDGTTYYLVNDGGTLGITTKSTDVTNWMITKSGVSCAISSISNGSSYELRYDSGWKLAKVSVSANEECYIGINSNFLSVSGNTISNATSLDSASIWVFSNLTDGGSTTITTTINGRKCYLTHSNNNLGISTSTKNSSWTVAATSAGYDFYYTVRNWSGYTYWDLNFVNGSWTVDSTGTDVTICAYPIPTSFPISFVEETFTRKEPRVTKTTTGMDYTGKDVTYFPLSTADDSYEASTRNTGYVIAGSSLTASSTDNSGIFKGGNIRVSHYPLSSSLTNYSSGALSNVRTIDENLQETTIDDSTASDTYKASKAKIESVLASTTQDYVYGLHFMNAAISTDNIVTAEYALINGTEHTNYELPANCIDFNLREIGNINFFAGSYFPGNRAFFSLHEIFRDSMNNVSNIKEISEIYSNKQDFYSVVYKYSDGTYSKAYKVDEKGNHIEDLTYPGNYPSDYVKVFDTARIKYNASIQRNYAYYFELPMNDGEFALGSVPGADGAYLMYLDIGASKRNTTQMTIGEHVKITETAYRFPQGVDFAMTLPTTSDGYATYTGGKSATIVVPSSGAATFEFGMSLTNGTMTLLRCTPSSGSVSTTYVNPTFLAYSGDTQISAAGVETVTEITSETTYDYSTGKTKREVTSKLVNGVESVTDDDSTGWEDSEITYTLEELKAIREIQTEIGELFTLTLAYETPSSSPIKISYAFNAYTRVYAITLSSTADAVVYASLSSIRAATDDQGDYSVTINGEAIAANFKNKIISIIASA